MNNPLSPLLHRQISIQRVFKGLFVAFAVITMVAFWVFSIAIGTAFLGSDESGDNFLTGTAEQDNTSCNVSSIPLHGQLVTYNMGDENMNDMVASENITYAIESDEKDDSIKAIILDIDSLGGSVVGAEEVANALKRIKKPTVALIHESGDSAGYWAATGANVIFASALSDVGSIGVTASYVQNIKNNQKEGYEFVSLSTGIHKDIGNPDRPLTAEERTMWQADLQKIHDVFVRTVAENRNMSIEKVQSLATGWSWLGSDALKLGLIDKIGGYDEAKAYLKDKIGEDIEICWTSF